MLGANRGQSGDRELVDLNAGGQPGEIRFPNEIDRRHRYGERLSIQNGLEAVMLGINGDGDRGWF